MNYTGKLYGKVKNKYFETGITSVDYDRKEQRIKELEEEVLSLRHDLKNIGSYGFDE